MALSAGAPAACRPPQSLLSCLSRRSRRRGRCAGAERPQQRMGLSDFQKTGPPCLNAVSICGPASRGRFVRTGSHIATPAGAAPLKRYCPRTLFASTSLAWVCAASCVNLCLMFNDSSCGLSTGRSRAYRITSCMLSSGQARNIAIRREGTGQAHWRNLVVLQSFGGNLESRGLRWGRAVMTIHLLRARCVH